MNYKNPKRGSMKKFKGFLIGLLFGGLVVSYYLHVKHLKEEFSNRIMSYEYLKNYHVWTDVFKTTKYTLDPSECSKNKEHRYFGITYSGKRATPNHTVAVDPTVVPLGSIMIDIETGQIYRAEDTGNAVLGRHIDVYIGQGTKANIKEASEWACKKRMFVVIEPTKN